MIWRAITGAFGVLMLLNSCSSTKSLPDNELLYTGATIKTQNDTAISRSERKDISSELEDLTRPIPNARVLGMPIRLWAYNAAYNKHKKVEKGGLFWNLFRRLTRAEPPVVSSELNLEKNREILENRLENKGFFHAGVTADTTLNVKRRRLSATYTASLGPQYKIRTVTYPQDSSVLSTAIRNHQRRSVLRPGRAYELQRIMRERDRLDLILKDEGFYYFKPEYLIAKVDSTVGNHQVDIFLNVKQETPYEARQVYKIGDIVVFADYELHDDTANPKAQAKYVNGYHIIDPENSFNPRIFTQTLIFDSGELYRRTDHNLSLNRLTTIGLYKFVKVRFEPVDTVADNRLNTFYYLTRLPKRSLRAEVSGLNKSNNATGSEVSLSYRNRNSFRGAELLTVTFFGGTEKQISGNLTNISTNRLGVDANLIIPRIFPFKWTTNSGFVPKTRINVGYEMFNRSTQYTLNSIKFLVGYNWKESITKEHQLNFININLVDPLVIQPEYQKMLDTNLTLRRTIEQQLILGSNYNFNYNSQVIPNRKLHNFFFNGNIDLSGNLIGLLTKADADKGKITTIRNVPVSQYTRLEADFRHYLRIDRTKTLASRLIVGSAWAYGNSTLMPFSKAFFIGGTNSIRAFRARSLGPGSYNAAASNFRGIIPDQPGDIKLELNTELRAKLFSIVHGALFVDAGNIWTQKEDETRPGSGFKKDFLRVIAVGAGVGLRFDLNFIVVRADFAWPLRKPWLAHPNQWVTGDIQFFNKDWQQDNLIINLAIGYPF